YAAVTMWLNPQPVAIAEASASQLHVKLAQGGPPMTYPFLGAIAVNNKGGGILNVQNIGATGAGISAYSYGNLAVVTADPGSLDRGIYSDGLVTIQCNAVHCPVRVPVSLEIVPKGPPVIQYRGAVNNATFQEGEAVTPGDIVIVKGEQFSDEPPASAHGLP